MERLTIDDCMKLAENVNTWFQSSVYSSGYYGSAKGFCVKLHKDISWTLKPITKIIVEENLRHVAGYSMKGKDTELSRLYDQAKQSYENRFDSRVRSIRD